jgi:peptidoglycan glycosyltransferase
VWALVPLAAAVAAVAIVSRSSEASLERGRERLRAGRPREAASALRRVRWPALAPRARGARSLAAALDGSVAPPRVSAPDLQGLDAEAVLVAALGRGDAAAAGRVTALLRDAGDPIGALYAAAFAFDAGDEEEARRLAAASPVPLASRGLGQRLASALDARARGARTFLWDRGGRLVATIDAEGQPSVAPDAVGAVDEPLARLADGADALPRESAGVRLTVDAELSRAALAALGAHRGSIVLLDPRAGALLAAVTDPATAAAEPFAAFAQRREPASIAKLLTTAAAYRAGVDADAEIRRMTCTGVERYGGKPLWCAFAAGPLEGGLDQALGTSCNIAFASLGQRVGREALLAEYRAWGFDAADRSLLGAAGRVRAEPRDPRGLADLAIGLELVDVTPLHAAALAAVVARGGRAAELRLVAGGSSPLALHDTPRPAAPGREVLAPPIAARLRTAMQAVARAGTGAGLAPDGFPVAMKTGTAATPGLGYHVNYVGMGPLPEPTVAFCVRVTGERSSPGVTQAAREVTRRLLEALALRAPRLAAR